MFKCSVDKCKNDVVKYGRCRYHLCINNECTSVGERKFVQNGTLECNDCITREGQQVYGQYWRPSMNPMERKLYELDVYLKQLREDNQRQLRNLETFAAELRNLVNNNHN